MSFSNTAATGRTGVFVVALAIGLAGCASRAPRYQPPALPVAANYPQDTGAGIGGASGIAAAWRDYYADPRLQSVIAEALEHNRDLRIAALRIRETRALYGIQSADLFPTIAGGFDGTYTRTTPGFGLMDQSIVTNRSQVGLNLSAWELDFWGRLRSLRSAALESYLASGEARRATVVSLIAQVADSYFTIRELDERIVLARQTIASRQESFRIFTRRFEVGSTSRLDLTQVEALLRQAESLGAQLEQSRALEAHALTLLVGAPVDIEALKNRYFEDQGGMPELPAGMPSELLTRRPDIIAAEHQLRGANANIGAARAAFFPRVTLIGSGGTASSEFTSLFAPGTAAWSFLPSISLPIFNAGRNRNNLKLAEVRRDSAVAGYEKTIQTAFREVSDALSAQRWLTEQVRIQQLTVAAQTERARLAKLRYDSGAASFLEVLDAQRELLSSAQQLVQIRRALSSSRVRLYAALGGGA